MICEVCSDEIPTGAEFQVGDKPHCSKCFFKVTEAFRGNLTPEQRRYLKEVIAQEMDGVLPKGLIKNVVADGFQRVVDRKASPEEEIGHIANRVEQICGLAMFREMAGIIEALETALGQQKEELYDKIRKLGKL